MDLKPLITPGERNRDGEAGGEATVLVGFDASVGTVTFLPTKKCLLTLTPTPSLLLICEVLASFKVAPPWNHGFGARFLSQSKISGHKAIVLTRSSRNGNFSLGFLLLSTRPFIESLMKTLTQCEPLITALFSLQEKVSLDPCLCFVVSLDSYIYFGISLEFYQLRVAQQSSVFDSRQRPHTVALKLSRAIQAQRANLPALLPGFERQAWSAFTMQRKCIYFDPYCVSKG